MTGDRGKPPDAPGGFSLRRWSQRKLAAAREAQAPPAAPSAPPVPSTPDSSAAVAPSATLPAAEAAPPALPSIESLTADSDFTPFMRRDVDRGLQHKALRKLFTDPRFNVMDGLDVYIDDYSKPDPIGADAVAGLAHARYLFDPPATRVDENGVVVDVPPSHPEDAGSDAPHESAATARSGPNADAAHAVTPANAGQASTRAPVELPTASDAHSSSAELTKTSGANEKQ